LNRKCSFSIQLHPNESNWIQLNPKKKYSLFKIRIRIEKKISIHSRLLSFSRPVKIHKNFNLLQIIRRIEQQVRKWNKNYTYMQPLPTIHTCRKEMPTGVMRLASSWVIQDVIYAFMGNIHSPFLFLSYIMS